MNKIIDFLEKYYIHSIIISFFLFLFYVFWINTSFLYTSILNYKNLTHDTFDWAIYPIKYVPDPIKLSYNERQKHFEDINPDDFISLPEYNPSIFWKNPEMLEKNSEEYVSTVTQRIIYTVPYMSTYNQDYKEYSGSHPRVDIAAPLWTPVFVIANWIVVDVWYQKKWFWNYILVRHDNVKLSNWNITNVYSLYAHLNEIFVKSWIKLKKWDIIWKVWKTWMATSEHLHFQIELETAPYHPFWPFSETDMQKAWVDFFQRVNIWLWKEKAIKYTINPFDFIHANRWESLYAETTDFSTFKEKGSEEKLVSSENLIEKKTKKKESLNLSTIITNTYNDTLYKENKNNLYTEKNNNYDKNNLIKKEEEKIEKIKLDDIILTSWIDVAFLWKDIEYLTQKLNLDDDKKNSETITKFEKTKENDDEINHVKNDDKNNNTKIIDEINKKETNEKIQEIENKEEIEENLNKKTELNENKNWFFKNQDNNNEYLFTDIDKNYKYFNELKYFKDLWVINWFSDNSFRPTKNISRRESLKIVIKSTKKEVKRTNYSNFLDLEVWTWQNDYVNLWVELWAISKENKYFYPQRNISRVERLKIIIQILWINIDNYYFDSQCFDDVLINTWYHKYVCYAKKYDLIDYDNNFYPNKKLNREELIKMLYKLQEK